MSSYGKESVKLCENIVRQAFGDTVARVASTLLNRGRLPAPTIARLSGLPSLTSLASLLILMQHNVVQSNGASVKETGEDEQYEFIPEECLLRLRWGRMLSITAERMDQTAVDVVKQILLHGKLRAPDIVSACGGDSDDMRADAVTAAIVNLLRNRFLNTTAPELQILRSDQIARRFAIIRRRTAQNQGSALLSANDTQNCVLEATHEVTTHLISLTSPERALVQKPKIETAAEKKKKKKYGAVAEQFDYDLKQDIFLRVDYDRYGVLIRNELVAQAAEDRWNKGAGIVMKAILEASLNETSSLSDDRTHDPVGLNAIAPHIPSECAPLLLAGLSSSSKSSLPDLVRHYLSLMSGENHASGTGSVFLSREGSTSPAYRVELESICQRMREAILGDMVREKLGDKAARVLEVVRRSNKAFETTIRDCAMLPLKDARQHLASLQRLSILETQEVPKTGSKINPAKGRPVGSVGGDWHLWAVDMPRVWGVLLGGVYKAIGNVLHMREEEVRKKALVLAREERVKGIEGGRAMLQLKDQEDLTELDDMLNKFTLAELRGELLVLVLRDLAGGLGAK